MSLITLLLSYGYCCYYNVRASYHLGTSLVYEPRTGALWYEPRIRASYSGSRYELLGTSLVYELMARIRAVYEARSAAV
jgi:hypothetical protein